MSDDTSAMTATATQTLPSTAAASAAAAAAQATQAAYPARYYALYDASASQPAPVMGWIDAWSLSDTAWLPPASQMQALTADQWSARLPTGQAVQSGAIVAYTPAAPTLAQQAQSAMAWVNQQAALAAAMGQVFGSAMKTYVQTLQALIAGTDTTSAALPTRPSNYSE